jgi:hypothetical protein
METIVDLERKYLRLSQNPSSNFIGLLDIFRSGLITYYYSKMFKFSISKQYLDRLKLLIKNTERLLEKDYRWSVGDYDQLGNEIKKSMKQYKKQYKTYTLPIAINYITNQLDLSNNEYIYTPVSDNLLLVPTGTTTYYNTNVSTQDLTNMALQTSTSPKDQYMFILNKISTLFTTPNRIDYGLEYISEDSLTLGHLQYAYQTLAQTIGLSNPLYQFKKELLDRLISNINSLATTLMTIYPGRNFTSTTVPIKILLSDALNFNQSIYNQPTLYLV